MTLRWSHCRDNEKARGCAALASQAVTFRLLPAAALLCRPALTAVSSSSPPLLCSALLRVVVQHVSLQSSPLHPLQLIVDVAALPSAACSSPHQQQMELLRSSHPLDRCITPAPTHIAASSALPLQSAFPALLPPALPSLLVDVVDVRHLPLPATASAALADAIDHLLTHLH